MEKNKFPKELFAVHAENGYDIIACQTLQVAIDNADMCEGDRVAVYELKTIGKLGLSIIPEEKKK